jgi:hypothetical protein
MHRSQLVGFVIDCKDADIDEAARFWSAALGRKVKPIVESDPNYRELETRPDEPALLLQRVTHESRIHLDIEADDKEAEVKRLEALGCKNLGFVKRWYVMEAPTGQRFCVVNPQRGALEGQPGANLWPDREP